VKGLWELCLQDPLLAGNSESANEVRHELEKRTWLKLENDESKADAKFNVSEERIQQPTSAGGQAVTVSGQITRVETRLAIARRGGQAYADGRLRIEKGNSG
jgi:hypothetical protein